MYIHFTEKQKRRHSRRKGTVQAELAAEAVRTLEEDVGDGETGEDTKKSHMQFEFPKFEGSPGPTPTLSPLSTPETISEAEVSEVS